MEEISYKEYIKSITEEVQDQIYRKRIGPFAVAELFEYKLLNECKELHDAYKEYSNGREI